MIRSAEAVWRGSGAEGSGNLTTPSGVLKQQPYSTKLRFVDEHGTDGTNPEELIAAAHAGCFSMALSFRLSGAGHVPEELRTKAVLTLLKNPEVGAELTGRGVNVSLAIVAAEALLAYVEGDRERAAEDFDTVAEEIGTRLAASNAGKDGAS